MAYNTKPIVTDKDGNPISQYYNPDTDSYEPAEGSGGGSKAVLYNADGTENNELSLIPILDKLSQLTGTVIDEETRKSNELQRIALYNQISQMLVSGELKGEKGDIGLGLEFDWQSTSLGVRVEGETEYVYVDLRGPQGEKGDTGEIENLDAQHIQDALGYVPADEDIVGMLADLTTDEKASLVAAINEVKMQSNDNATEITTKVSKNGDSLTGVYRLKSISFINICDFLNSSIKNAIKIKTKIPATASERYTVDITGYQYDYSVAKFIDCQIGFNVGGGVAFYGSGVMKRGNTLTPEIKLAHEDGFVVIEIGISAGLVGLGIESKMLATVVDPLVMDNWVVVDEKLKETAEKIKVLAYI